MVQGYFAIYLYNKLRQIMKTVKLFYFYFLIILVGMVFYLRNVFFLSLPVKMGSLLLRQIKDGLARAL